MSFTLLKRNCPICDGIRRDCRQNNQNALIHCRANLNIIPLGWKARGQDKWGFEIYAPTSDEQSSEAWQQRQQERSLQRQRELEELRHGALPEAGRDQAIRRIHRHFGISSKHRQNLRDRGLSDSHIDQTPYFTFYPRQEVPPFTPASLPGVSRGRLSVKRKGFTCPIANIDGQIIGWQNRFDDGEPKYTWASGDTSSHLPSGELPIGVYRPDGGVVRCAIGMAEGFLKADIIAQLWGLPTLGAASANFAASAEQSKASLERLSAELGTKQIYWFADAGSVSNPHVNTQYQRSWELLSEWGYGVKLLWYGQTEKSVGDADEVSQEVQESARLISIDEYCAIALEHGGIKESSVAQNAPRPIPRDEWELKHGFGKRLRERIKRTLEGFKGFGECPQQTVVTNPPTQPPDQLFQEASQRLQVWRDAINRGYRYILDASAPGLGKSHAAGIALPEAFGAERLWYLASDHRNPTTGVIESTYVDLPVRHNGLKVDDTRQTPNGNPFLVWPKIGEEPDTQGNCFRADLFQRFRAKNLNVEASETSPICENCKVAFLCKQGIGKNATFRGDRKNALEAKRIRAHADSLPIDFDYSSSGLLWDEIGSQLKPMDSVTATLADFDQIWGELETKAPDLHELLKPLRLALRPLLTGELKHPYHGWDDAGVRALLPEKPAALDEIIAELETILQPDLSFLEERPDSVTSDEAKGLGVSAAMQRLVNREFRRQAHQGFSSGFQRLALNWLNPFLRVWAGERGALRCEFQKLMIFTHSDRHPSIARAAKFNIFLDGTITRDHLALLLGIHPCEIYVVSQQTPNNGNLNIIQVTGMGKLGKDRSDSMQRRVAALKRALEEQHPGIIFGDWKAHAEDGDGQWFVNLRGSNEFQGASAMATLGVPYQNVGYQQALYKTLTGEFAPLDRETPHEGLQEFIEAHTRAEIEQAVHRLRSHIRPNEQLTFIFVGDYDLSFLGLPVEQIEAFQVCPEAGTPAQVTRWKILEAIRSLQNQGRKVTQQAIATIADVSQPTIAKIASQFGGWKTLQKLLLGLLDPFYSGSNNFSGLSDKQKDLVKNYLSPIVEFSAEAPEVTLPPEALEENTAAVATAVVRCLELLGFAAFLEAVRHFMAAQTQANLLSVLLRGVPGVLEFI